MGRVRHLWDLILSLLAEDNLPEAHDEVFSAGGVRVFNKTSHGPDEEQVLRGNKCMSFVFYYIIFLFPSFHVEF